MKKIKRPADSTVHIIIKWLMTAVFAWSGFLWSGITILQFLINNQEHRNLSVEFLIGSLILLLCLTLNWLRFYILQIIPGVIGLIVYLNPAKEMIDHASNTGGIFKPTFEQRYLPITVFGILALVLFVMRVLSLINAKMKRDEQFNNLPSESILDKHREN